MPLARVLAEKRNRRVLRQLVIVITILFLAGTGFVITLGNRVIFSKPNVTPLKIAEVRRKDKVIKTSTIPVRQREEASKPRNEVKNPTPEPERLVSREEPISLPSRNERTLLVIT